MELWFFLAAGALFLAALAVYGIFMVFFPEWIGITGKKALAAEKSHTSGEVEKADNLIDRMQK